MSESAVCLGEGGSGVADGDGNEFHLCPLRFESVDEWVVLVGLLLKILGATEVPAESDLDDDEVALLAVESALVRRGGVRDSSSVDEVGPSGVVPCPALNRTSWVSLDGQYTVRMRVGVAVKPESPTLAV